MRISAIDYYLPRTIETLADLGAANPEWDTAKILCKTGVERRHVAASDETPLAMAEAAARKLLAELDGTVIDGLIYVTQSPDSLIPATACLLQDRLGLRKDSMAFDLNQGCSGFVYGLSVAAATIGTGMIENALVVCAEVYNRYISRHDRTCRPLFSDGASAALVSGNESGSIGPFVFLTDGSGAPNLTLKPHQPGDDVPGPRLFMDGGRVLRFTASEVPRAVHALLERSGRAMDDIDMFVFHQASEVVLNKLQHVLAIPDARFLRNYRDLGNTVSGTIPIALKQATDDGVIEPGMRLMLVGFGVGYSLAGCLIEP
jgi:3-oxoacyl-[acyl-carrier-protein] synthase-3